MRGHGQLGHFIEEYSAAIGFLEVTLTRGHGSGEGAFFVAEKLGIDCAFGNGAAIDGNVLGMLARRVLVDDFRKKFLARTGLSGDENAQVYRGNAYGACHRLGKGR